MKNSFIKYIYTYMCTRIYKKKKEEMMVRLGYINKSPSAVVYQKAKKTHVSKVCFFF